MQKLKLFNIPLSIPFFLLLFFTAPLIANAENFNVLITSKDPLLIRKISTVETLPLFVPDNKDNSFFKKLKVGDFISFEGLENTRNKSIQFLSVNFVGLRDLLGTWYNPTNKTCVYIQSFTDIVVFPSQGDEICLHQKATSYRSLSYTVNPENRNAWVALITDQEKTYLADFTFKTRRELFLKITNNDSDGNVSTPDETYNLTKISE